MEVHDVCNIFPEMSETEYDELVKDVARHGVVEPIWVYQGRIVDGRHRYRAACATGKTFSTQEWIGESHTLIEFVVSRNLQRRHLDTKARSRLALKIKPMISAAIAEGMREKSRQGGRIAGNHRPRKDESKGLSHLVQPLEVERPRDALGEAARMCNVGRTSVAREQREVEQQAKREPFGNPNDFPEAKPPPRDRIPVDPIDASRTILRYFRGEDLSILLRELANHAGFDLIPNGGHS